MSTYYALRFGGDDEVYMVEGPVPRAQEVILDGHGQRWVVERVTHRMYPTHVGWQTAPEVLARGFQR